LIQALAKCAGVSLSTALRLTCSRQPRFAFVPTMACQHAGCKALLGKYKELERKCKEMERELEDFKRKSKHVSLVPERGVSPRQPSSLGPFRVAPLEFKSIGLTVDLRSNSYQVDLESAPLRAVKAYVPDLLNFGSLSPIRRLTLRATSSASTDTDPSELEQFVFAYPFAGIAGTIGIERMNLADPCISFLVFGGFIHFDEGMAVTSVKSLSKGDGLHFAGPFPFHFQGLREDLFRQGRVQDVTLASLVELGAKGFCWLPPPQPSGETDEDVEFLEDVEEVSARAEWPNGAFLYTYEDPSMDCIFRVSRVARPRRSKRMVPFVAKTNVSTKRRCMTEKGTIEFTCRLCENDPIEVCFAPCGHLFLCRSCDAKHGSEFKTCSMCNQEVCTRSRVYL